MKGNHSVKFTLISIITLTLLGVVIVSIAGIIYAQQSEEWSKTFGGPREDWAHSVQQTVDGGYIIAGSTYSFGGGERSVYLVKTDSEGNMLWNRTVGFISGGGAGGNSVQQTVDGGYIVAGSTYYFDEGEDYIYLIKTDSDGDLLWNKTFGGSEIDYGSSVQQTTDGGYIIAGGTKSFGESTDVFLIKTDSEGNVLWNRTFGGPEDDWGRSVQQTTDGGYIIAGNTAFSSYLVKTDPEGEELWSRVLNMVNEGGYEEGGAECVQQTADGGYIVSGWSGYLEFSSGPNWVRGNVNILLFKIDSDGDLLWNRTFGGAEYHSGSSVQQTIDGGYIVVGIAHKQPNDVYLCKTDSYGNLLWDKTFGGSNNDYGYSVQQTTDGGYIIAGSTYSFGAGTLDVYLIKLAPRAEPTPEPSATPEPSSSPEPTPEPTPEQNPGGIPGFPYLAIVFGILLSLLIFKKIQS